jgi:hypothetical protein
MNSKDLSEDAAFFLYLAPIIAAIVYGAVEWYKVSRTSHEMPLLAYLIVAKDPYLFLFSIAAICAAIVIEVRATNYEDRTRVILANTTRMQILGVVVILISFAAALSNAGYADVGTAFGVFLNGRFALIFGFFLLGTSILLAPSQLIGRAGTNMFVELIGLLLIGLSPAVLYGATRIHIPLSASAGAATIVFIVGLYVVISGTKLFTRKSTSAPAVALQPSA